MTPLRIDKHSQYRSIMNDSSKTCLVTSDEVECLTYYQILHTLKFLNAFVIP